MIARLLLSTIGIIPDNECFHKDFRLHMYASFANRDEAIILDLLEMLDKVQKKKGLE